VFVPLQRIEIANLNPVEAVWMSLKNGDIVLLTDTENEGRGITFEKALLDMKENSPGVVYIDTAKFLFVSDSALTEISKVRPFIKGTIQLCKWEGQGTIKDAVKYADSHNVGVKLCEWSNIGKLPELPPLEKEK
jgi:hypothetical protein